MVQGIARPRRGRHFIARQRETVFNACRSQGDHGHTPLTRIGFAQVDEMEAALRKLALIEGGCESVAHHGSGHAPA